MLTLQADVEHEGDVAQATVRLSYTYNASTRHLLSYVARELMPFSQALVMFTQFMGGYVPAGPIVQQYRN